MSTTRSCPDSEIFGDPSAWREEAIHELELADESRCAGASTSPAMPQLIQAFAERLSQLPPGPAADVGGGLGPASWWLTKRTGHRFVTLDPSASSCAGASRLFGVPAVRATASDLPLAAGSCTATLLNGVVSLLDELAGSVGEAVRITRPGGLVAMSDLTSTGDRRVVTTTNTFWTSDELAAALVRAGCVVDYVACSEPGIGHWAEVQSVVEDLVLQRHAGEPSFEDWQTDRDRIGALVTASRVAGTCLIAQLPT